MKREKEIKSRVDVVIDAMNTLRFLCELDTKQTPEKLYADSKNNDVLVFNNDYMWEICETLDRMPNIDHIEWESESPNQFKVSMYYRGIEFHTYIKEEEKAFFEDKITEYEAKLWEAMENHDHDDDEE